MRVTRKWWKDFEISQEIQELRENLENQDTKKITSTWLNVLTSWACEVKQPDENKQMALHDWISQVVV